MAFANISQTFNTIPVQEIEKVDPLKVHFFLIEGSLMKQNMSAKIETLATPFAEEAGLSIYDIEVEAGSKTLRLFIDKEGGVQLEDCEKVARPLDQAMTEANIYDGDFTLEVSSPGIERKLKKRWHYEKVLGQKIEVKLFEALGRIHQDAPKALVRAKTLQGNLAELKDEELVLQIEDEAFSLPFEKVTKAHLVYEF